MKASQQVTKGSLLVLCGALNGVPPGVYINARKKRSTIGALGANRSRMTS